MERRDGDAIAIAGDYQHKATHSRFAAQRFWHYAKKMAIRRFMPPIPGNLVLDVGCGSGVITDFLGTFNCQAVGIDANMKAIEFAQKKFGRDNVRFQGGLVDESFEIEHLVDKIYCLEVIEHIYFQQTEIMLANFSRLLKGGGKVLLTTPNYLSIWPFIQLALDKFRLVPHLGGDQHVVHYNPFRLINIVRKAGFNVATIRTSCFLAPWLAGLSWHLAIGVDKIEILSHWPFGSILLCVLRKKV